jgi:hypothetical protein
MDSMMDLSKGKVSSRQSCEKEDEVAHTGLRTGSSSSICEETGFGSVVESRTT